MDPTKRAIADADANTLRSVLARLGDLETRVQSLELGGRQVFVSNGPPSFAAPDGSLCVDVNTPRLYGRAAGAWRYSALT